VRKKEQGGTDNQVKENLSSKRITLTSVISFGALLLIAGCASSKTTVESNVPLDPELYSEEPFFNLAPSPDKSDVKSQEPSEEIKSKPEAPGLEKAETSQPKRIVQPGEKAPREKPEPPTKPKQQQKTARKLEEHPKVEAKPLSPHKTSPVEPGSLATRAKPKTDQRAILKPGLMLSFDVSVAGETEISETRRIAENGLVSLPLLGRFKVEGMTIDELARMLEAKYAESYFVNPTVEVGFFLDGSEGAVSPWGSVTVLGRVNKPGRVGMPPTRDMTVSLAIQKAGGFNSSAKQTAIRVTRSVPGGKDETIKVNLEKVGSRGRHEDDIELKAGDVIFVPESFF